MEQPIQKENNQVKSSPISMPQGAITRSWDKKLQQALIHHVQGLMISVSEGLQGFQSFGSNGSQVQFNVFQVQVKIQGESREVKEGGSGNLEKGTTAVYQAMPLTYTVSHTTMLSSVSA